MTDNAKQTILLNYGLMIADVYSEIKEHSAFISKSFRENMELNTDRDLIKVGEKFRELCQKLKELDDTINSIY